MKDEDEGVIGYRSVTSGLVCACVWEIVKVRSVVAQCHFWQVKLSSRVLAQTEHRHPTAGKHTCINNKNGKRN